MEKHAGVNCCAGGDQNNKCSVFCSSCPKNVRQIRSVIIKPSGWNSERDGKKSKYIKSM
jgi:hypothetical protein